MALHADALRTSGLPGARRQTLEERNAEIAGSRELCFALIAPVSNGHLANEVERMRALDGYYADRLRKADIPMGKRSDGRVRAGLVLVFTVILISGAFLFAVNSCDDGASHPEQLQKARAFYSSHAPIRINNNTDLTINSTSGVVRGSGTASDPYLIDGWDIDAHGGLYNIYVGNTTNYFQIVNCNLHNATPEGSGESDTGIGVDIINVTNGAITRTLISSNAVGISIWDSTTFPGESDNILVANNTISSCSMFGFYSASYSPTLVMSGNLVQNNLGGIMAFGRNNQYHDNLLWNNTGPGIMMYGSYNMAWNNSFYNNNGAGSTYEPAHAQAVDYGIGNSWNTTDGYGNFWSDLTGPDSNLDGVVDLPYDIPSASQDHYPRTTSLQPIPELALMPLIVMIVPASLIVMRRIRRRNGAG